MRYKISVRTRTEKDAQHIFDYVADRSPEGVLRWWDVLQQAAWKITENPERYGYTPENSLFTFANFCSNPDVEESIGKSLQSLTTKFAFFESAVQGKPLWKKMKCLSNRLVHHQKIVGCDELSTGGNTVGPLGGT